MIKREFLLDFFLGIILPFLLAFIALWRVFVTPGFVFYGDMGFPVFLSVWLDHVFHPWNVLYNSPNSIISYLNVLRFAVPFWLGLSPESSERLWMLSSYAFTGISMYFAARLLLSRERNDLAYFVGCIIASTSYMINKYAMAMIHIPGLLFSYACIPIAIALYIHTLKDEKHTFRNCLATSLFLSLSISFTQFFAIILSIMLLYFIYVMLMNRRSFTVYFKKNLTIFLLFLAINAYWIVPTYLSPPLSSAIQPVSPLRFSEEGIYGKPYSTLINVISLNVGYGLKLPSTLLSKIAGLLIPLTAVSVLLIPMSNIHYKRILSFHALLYLIAFPLTVRSQPFISIPLFLGRYFFNTGVWWQFLRNPDHFYPLLIYPLALMLGLFAQKIASTIHSRVIKNRTKIIFLALLLMVAGNQVIYSSYPASGDLLGKLTPITIPQEYQDANTLIRQRKGYFRVWWLPEPFGHQRLTWAPENPRPERWHSYLSSVPMLVSRSDFLQYVYLHEILNGVNNHVVKSLFPFNVAYVIVHTDTRGDFVTGEASKRNKAILSSLSKQGDIKLSYKGDFIRIYEVTNTTPPVFISPRLALIVGGYGVYMALTELKWFKPTDYAIVYAEQLSAEYLGKVLDVADLVFFSWYKNLQDLYLLLASEYWVDPVNDFITIPKNSWSVESFSVATIYSSLRISEKPINLEGDFPQAGTVVTSKASNATLKITISVSRSGSYRLFARVLESPLGSLLSFYIDESNLVTVNCYSLYTHFSWRELGAIFLSQGKHNICVVSINGTNSLDLLSIIPEEDYNLLKAYTLERLKDKTVIKVDRIFLTTRSLEDQVGGRDAMDSAKWAGEWLGGEWLVGQTFVPDHSNISKIVLYLSRKSEGAKDLIVELHTTDESGLPTAEVLASVVIPSNEIPRQTAGPVEISLSYSGLSVGRTYAIILREMGGRPGDYNLARTLRYQEDYKRGNLVLSRDGGLSWIKSDQDLLFETYYSREEQTFNPREGERAVVRLYLWNLTDNSVNTFASDEQHPFLIPVKISVLNFTRDFPEKYIITVKADGPFILVVSETYDPLWCVTNIESLHIPAYSTLNAYYINKTGEFQVIIEYLQAPYFTVGMFSSVFSLQVLIIAVLAREKLYKVKSSILREIRK